MGSERFDQLIKLIRRFPLHLTRDIQRVRQRRPPTSTTTTSTSTSTSSALRLRRHQAQGVAVNLLPRKILGAQPLEAAAERRIAHGVGERQGRAGAVNGVASAGAGAGAGGGWGEEADAPEIVPVRLFVRGGLGEWVWCGVVW
jgi:hypothetical protein